MNKPDYTPAELVRAHERYNTLCAAVAMCPLLEVRELWESAVTNGIDTCDDIASLRKDWNMPELTTADVEAIISISSACGLVPERMYSQRVRTWFYNRGVEG